jgi:hypothetical protein
MNRIHGIPHTEYWELLFIPKFTLILFNHPLQLF